MPIVNSLVSWYLKRRIPVIEEMFQNPDAIQYNQLMYLLKTASITEFGKQYDFASIKHEDEFKQRVPVTDYDSFKHYIIRMLRGEQNILWPTEVKWFAKSSGTTSDKSKFIPITYESLEDCHLRGGKDALMLYFEKRPDSELLNGKGLVIGGSHQINSLNSESYYGDLSAVIMYNMPIWSQYFRTPDLSIAIMDNWDEKIEKMARATIGEDVTSISGVPTWTIVLIEYLYEITGYNNLSDIWPNLELYMHGGVSFTPYQQRFKQLIRSSKVNYMEIYNASEGFFAIQDDIDSEKKEMLLMLDYGIYYEFMPLSELGKEFPKTYSLSEVNTNEIYAIVISSNAGLWRYIVGDTVQFTSIKPYRIKITGRTKHFINAFGEELMIENADRAIEHACKMTNASIADYTVAPVYMTSNNKGGHEWIIEFTQKPESLEIFTDELDAELKRLNSDYEAKRYMDMAMLKPVIRVAPKGTFNEWLKLKGKLGGQHKVPRLCNNREILESILELMKSEQQLQVFAN